MPRALKEAVSPGLRPSCGWQDGLQSLVLFAETPFSLAVQSPRLSPPHCPSNNTPPLTAVFIDHCPHIFDHEDQLGRFDLVTFPFPPYLQIT